MSRRKRAGSQGGSDDAINMTPMIDIVFQMIIFFVCTVELEKNAMDENVRLAMAPHGPQVVKKDPRTIVVDVDGRGRILIARRHLSPNEFQSIMLSAVSKFGQTIPVVIRGDTKTKHEDVKRIMDICSSAGLWKVKFAAVKDPAKKGSKG